jgi:CPA1 family monovalent cation:H+ antiporter
MHRDTIVFWMLLATAVLAVVAKRFRLPYPIAFLIGGVILALVPGLPSVSLEADLVFLIFLPPLLFGNAWTTDWREFKANIGPIAMLATGCVLFTTTAVAYVAHAWIGLPLAAAFVLGAIVSPPDAVATEAVAEDLSLPRQITAILSGESLINDASALVVYSFAIAAVVTGAFSLPAAIGQFFYVSIVGIAFGLLVGFLFVQAQEILNRKGLADELIDTTLTLIAPFVSYLPAEAVHASGVLATVAAGFYISRRAPVIFSSETRIAAASVWNLLFFVLNGAVFILIGLELREILARLTAYPLSLLVGWGLGISVLVIVLRFAWIYPAAYVRRAVMHAVFGKKLPNAPWQWTFVLSWSGMRGIVSLAAALALPGFTASGEAFPGRDLIVFLSFCVIAVTLVGQGLTLPWLIKALHVMEQDTTVRMETEARIAALTAARKHLTTLEPTFQSTAQWEIAGRIYAAYDNRIEHFRAHLNGRGPEAGDEPATVQIEHELDHQAIAAERAALQELRRLGKITDDVYRRLEWEIDLSESRLK